MTFTAHQTNSSQHWDKWDCVYCDYTKNKSTANHTWAWTWSNTQHYEYCTGCGASGTTAHTCPSTQSHENHTLVWVKQSDTQCRQECIDPDGDVCGYHTANSNHQWVYSNNGGNHTKTCSRCSHAITESHDLAWTDLSVTQHREYCKDNCGYSVDEGHVWNSSKVCTECGRTCAHGSKSYWYSDNGSDANHTKTQKCDYCSKVISTTTSAHSYGTDNVCDTQNPNGTKCGHTCGHSSTSCKSKSPANQTYHDIICDYCGYDRGDEEHVWSSGTCTHCQYTCNHSWGSWSSNGSSTHSRTCSNCGKEETENHTWGSWGTGNSSNHTRSCSKCPATNSAAHSWGDWTYSDSTYHTRSCTVCGRSGSGTHSWSDGYCSTCDTHCLHDWVWKTNGDLTASGHTRTCSYCGDSEFGYHTWGGDHGYTCTVCLAVCNYCDNFSDLVYAGNVGHTSGTMIHQSKYKCSNCNYTKTVDENCADYKVSASGYNSGVYDSSTHQVWTAKCSRCGWGWLSNVAHSFSYTYDSISESVAGKIYTHTKYYSCGCGYSGSTVEDCPTEDITPSSYTSNNDGTHYALTQRCKNRCGWGRRTTSNCYLPWSSDSSTHWRQCGYCYYRTSSGFHSWSGWKIDESNSQHYKACNTCGREKDRTNCTWSGIWPAQKCSVCGNYRIDGGGIPNFDGVLTPTGLLTVAGDDNHKQVGALNRPDTISQNDEQETTQQSGPVQIHSMYCSGLDCDGLNCDGLNCDGLDCYGLDCYGLDCEDCSFGEVVCETASCEVDYASAICRENRYNSLGGWDYEFVDGKTLADSIVIKPATDNNDIYQDDTLNKVCDKYSIEVVTLETNNIVSKNNDSEDDSNSEN